MLCRSSLPAVPSAAVHAFNPAGEGGEGGSGVAGGSGGSLNVGGLTGGFSRPSLSGSQNGLSSATAKAQVSTPPSIYPMSLPHS